MKKYAYGLATIGSLIGMNSFAAADTDVTTAASGVATVLKENLIAVLGDNIPVVILGGVLILGVGVVWRLAKRFTK